MKDLVNLLVVDDDCEFRDLLEEVLIRNQFSLITAKSIDATYEIIEKYEVDAILCDLNLQGRSGFDLLWDLRLKGSDVPFVLMSGQIEYEDLLDACRLGVFDMFEKPFDIKTLVESCMNAINLGIHSRLTLNKLQKILSENDYKSISSALSKGAKLRAKSFESRKLS